MQGMFVSFEGSEGAGKSTLIRLLAETLRADEIEVEVTREPGAGTVGGAIRQILLHGEELDPTAELFLFLADRSQHVTRVIRPALDRGAWVLCDRYADSTVVYQGYGRGLDVARLRELNREATMGLSPDVTFLLDLDPAIGLARIASKDRLDSEPIEFHRKVRDGFLTEARFEPERWVVLDASEEPERILANALSVLKMRR